MLFAATQSKRMSGSRQLLKQRVSTGCKEKLFPLKSPPALEEQWLKQPVLFSHEGPFRSRLGKALSSHV